MIIGSLFSGIGGFELGLQRGLGASSVAWQVELDPWCRQVLARHWPDAARHDDVRAVGAHNLAPVDVLCGGFPCQDISTAGAGAGLAGARSGLWFEMLRIVTELRPQYVVVENVRALRKRGLSVVRAGLAEAGYRVSWSIVSAGDLGAPHERARLWIVASRLDVPAVDAPVVTEDDRAECLRDVWPRGGDPEPWERGEPRTTTEKYERPDRLRALGNAVVPQIPRIIGRCLRGERSGFALQVQGRPGLTAWLPTPTATTYGTNTNPGAAPRPSLDQMARRGLWATPTVCGNYNRKGASPTSGDGLATQVAARQWATPCAHNAKGPPGAGSRENGGRQADLCAQVAARQWHTPTAHNAKEGGFPAEYTLNTPTLTAQVLGDPTQRGTLSPRWVELLMGYPLDWTVP